MAERRAWFGMPRLEHSPFLSGAVVAFYRISVWNRRQALLSCSTLVSSPRACP